MVKFQSSKLFQKGVGFLIGKKLSKLNPTLKLFFEIIPFTFFEETVSWLRGHSFFANISAKRKI